LKQSSQIVKLLPFTQPSANVHRFLYNGMFKIDVGTIRMKRFTARATVDESINFFLRTASRSAKKTHDSRRSWLGSYQSLAAVFPKHIVIVRSLNEDVSHC